MFDSSVPTDSRFAPVKRPRVASTNEYDPDLLMGTY